MKNNVTGHAGSRQKRHDVIYIGVKENSIDAAFLSLTKAEKIYMVLKMSLSNKWQDSFF